MSNHKAVVSLAERENDDRGRDLMLFTEAVAKDDPSPEARAYFDAQLEREPEAWRRHGDLAAEALDLALKDFCLGYVTKASVKLGAELLKRRLGYEDASPAEQVLIEHAVLCHVRLGMVEHMYSRVTSGGNNAETVEHYEKRLTMAQKRFMRAVETLAKVRGLLARAEAARDAAARARSARGLAVLKQMPG